MKLLFVVVCLSVLSACADPSVTTHSRPSAEQVTEQIAEKALSRSGDTAGLSEIELEVQWEARGVLATHLTLPDVNGAELVLISPRQWPNGGMGCPQPGFFYTQAVSPGHKVVLELDGVQHHIHMVDGGGLVCERLQDSELAADAFKADPLFVPQAQ